MYPSSCVILKETSCHRPARITTEVFNKQQLGVWLRNERDTRRKNPLKVSDKKRELLGGKFLVFLFGFVFQEGKNANGAVMGELFCQGILLGPGHMFQICSHFKLVLILMPVKLRC